MKSNLPLRIGVGHIMIGVIGVISLAVALITWYIKAGTVRTYREMVNQWERDLADIKIAPTPENVSFLQREHEWIVDREIGLRQSLLKKVIPYRGLTPLQFKEELLSTQVKLKQLADIQGCKLQEDLGFPEYTAGEIPQPGEVAQNAKQLMVINELVNLLLRHKASEIDSITRLPDIATVADKEGNLYQEMAFQLKLQCTLEDLLGVFGDIINAPYILVVRNLKINKLAGNRIGVEMLIGVCEFTG